MSSSSSAARREARHSDDELVAGGVGHTDDPDHSDLGMAEELLLDLDRETFAPRSDHLRRPAGEMESVLFVR